MQFGRVDVQEFASWETYGKMASRLQIIFDVRWIDDGPLDSFQITPSQRTTQAVMAVLFGLTIAKGDLAHT